MNNKMIPVVLQVSTLNESMPDRSFRKIGDSTVFEFLLLRLLENVQLDVSLVTTCDASDDVLCKTARLHGIRVFRGDYPQIVDRLKKFTTETGGDNFVRVFGNYPLVDIPRLITLYRRHVNGKFDYSYNEHMHGVLWGTGCEVFSSKILEVLSKQNLSVQQQSTLSYYIRQHVDEFNVQKMEINSYRKSFKVNLETEKDLEVINDIVNNIQVDITSDNISSYLDKHKVVSTYNLEKPSKEVGVDKILLHPHKIESILEGDSRFTSFPISVELTLTNACNLKCIYCSDADLRQKQGVNSDMDKEVLFKLFDDLAEGGTKGITIEGGGEPSIYPYFSEIVKYAYHKKLALGLITNGVKRIDKELVKYFEWIRVSLDASTREEYYELKGVDCFEKVIANIGYYSQYCDTVGVGYVVTNSNLSQIEALVSRLRLLGASYIQLRPVVDNDELYPRDVDLNFLKVFSSKNFGVIIDGMKENAQKGNFGLPCVAHSLTSIISGDGSVYLCGRLNIYDWIPPIGNINEESFSSIWNGQEHRKQCAKVRDSAFCEENCPQCRISKFNSLFARVTNIKSKHFI